MVEKRGAVPPYAIALMQVAIKSCTHAKNVEDGIKIRRENVDHYCELIDSSFKIPRSMAARHACMQGWWPANNYLKNPPTKSYPGPIDAKIRKEMTNKLIKRGVITPP